MDFHLSFFCSLSLSYLFSLHLFFLSFSLTPSFGVAFLVFRGLPVLFDMPGVCCLTGGCSRLVPAGGGLVVLSMMSYCNLYVYICVSMAKNKTPLDLLLLSRLLFLLELSSRNKLVYLFGSGRNRVSGFPDPLTSPGESKIFKFSEQHCGCNINF